MHYSTSCMCVCMLTEKYVYVEGGAYSNQFSCCSWNCHSLLSPQRQSQRKLACHLPAIWRFLPASEWGCGVGLRRSCDLRAAHCVLCFCTTKKTLVKKEHIWLCDFVLVLFLLFSFKSLFAYKLLQLILPPQL